MVMTPAQAAADIADLRSRNDDASFDVVVIGASDGPDAPVLREFADAGFTWWLEHIHNGRGPFGQLLARVNAGPPSRPRGYEARPPR